MIRRTAAFPLLAALAVACGPRDRAAAPPRQPAAPYGALPPGAAPAPVERLQLPAAVPAHALRGTHTLILSTSTWEAFWRAAGAPAPSIDHDSHAVLFVRGAPGARTTPWAYADSQGIHLVLDPGSLAGPGQPGEVSAYRIPRRRGPVTSVDLAPPVPPRGRDTHSTHTTP